MKIYKMLELKEKTWTERHTGCPTKYEGRKTIWESFWSSDLFEKFSGQTFFTCIIIEIITIFSIVVLGKPKCGLPFYTVNIKGDVEVT